MQGNCYILVPDAEKNNPVPVKLKNKWAFKDPVTDANGIQAGEVDVHPSWLGAANRLKQYFGDIRELSIDGKPFTLIELELSFIEGEVAEVLKLQSNKPRDYKYYILTATEAQELLSGKTIPEILAMR